VDKDSNLQYLVVKIIVFNTRERSQFRALGERRKAVSNTLWIKIKIADSGTWWIEIANSSTW
jgi:hypothetical protein